MPTSPTRGPRRRRPSRFSGSAIVAATLAAHVALPLAGCNPPPPAYTPPPPPEVTVAHPIQRDIPDTMEFTATVRGVREVEIRARVSGFLEHKHLDGGTRVEAGQDLFTLDTRPFVAAVKEAEAIVRQREAELAQAELRLTREQEAISRGASSAQQMDDAAAQRDVALAMVDLAKAQLDRANLDEEWANMQAPIAGRMGFAQAEEGDLISINQWLATIVDDSKVYAVYDIDERTLLQLRSRYENLRPGEDGRPHLEVRLGMSSEEGFPHIGRFYRAEAEVNPDTGTIRVEAEFDNPRGAILPGTFVRVQPVFGDRPALLVPDIAVQSDQGGRYVLVVDQGGMVHRVPVRLTGPVYERMRPVEEVIGEPLNGDPPPEPRLTTEARVIVNGLQRARAGFPVSSYFEGEKPEAPAAPAAGGGH